MFQKLSSLLAICFCMAFCAVFAENVSPEMPPRDAGLWQTLTMVAIALIFFYFILWRPEQKRRKEVDAKRDSMRKGDKVTAMGIIGTVSKVQEHTVILKMVDGAKIEFLKAAISEVLPASEQEAAKADKDD